MTPDIDPPRRRSEDRGRSGLHKAWKRLPRWIRFSASVMRQSAALAILPIRAGLFWRRRRRWAAGSVIYVAGFFSATSGVGRSARLFASALEAGGVSTVRVDVGARLGAEPDLETLARSGDDGGAGVVVSQLNPPELLRWLAGPGAGVVRGRRHIGYWFWELPKAPTPWRSALGYVDEIWCQSRFTQAALTGLGPSRPEVQILPHPIFMTPRPTPDRARFGVAECGCAVLASFDLHSSSARKNPLGAVEAFVRAVPRPDRSRAILVCKARGLNLDAELGAARQLRDVAASRPDIEVIDASLTDLDMAVLVASVDVVLSLHRAEGFGLVAAEGLWMGRAVVATGWSGVTDFLDEDCAELVAYTLKRVSDQQGIYQGGVWAEPDLDDAARRLRHLIEAPEYRERLGVKAREKADRIFSQDAWFERVRPMLGLSPPPATAA